MFSFVYAYCYCRRPLQTTARLLLFLFLLHSSPVLAGDMPPRQASDGGMCSELSASAALPLSLGGNRDKEALAPRNVRSPSSTTEQLFGGTFLGALIFGYPYDGLGFLDILIMGLLALVLVRALAAKRRRQGDDRLSSGPRSNDRLSPGRWSERNMQETQGKNGEKPRIGVEDLRPGASGGRDVPGARGDTVWSRRLRGEGGVSRPEGRKLPENVQENAASMWARLSSGEHSQDEPLAAALADGVEVPPGFDVHDFLEGARTLYVRLQQAWAARKVDELAPFVSAQMLELLRKQAAANPGPAPVEILFVNATVNKLSRDEGAEKAEVAFNAIMRTGQEEESTEVDELWLFTRSPDSNGMWQLTGIRQG